MCDCVCTTNMCDCVRTTNDAEHVECTQQHVRGWTQLQVCNQRRLMSDEYNVLLADLVYSFSMRLMSLHVAVKRACGYLVQFHRTARTLNCNRSLQTSVVSSKVGGATQPESSFQSRWKSGSPRSSIVHSQKADCFALSCGYPSDESDTDVPEFFIS